MSQRIENFNCFVNLSGTECPKDIDLGLVRCYAYHQKDLLDVLVLSDADQKLKMKNIAAKDVLRFECKLQGKKQLFSGSVSSTADKILAMGPSQSWSQSIQLFKDGETDKNRKSAGDAKIVLLLRITKASFKASTLEERVYEVEEDLAADMGDLQADDKNMVDRLDVLDKHHNDLQQTHEADAKKNEETQKYLSDLLQVIGEMKDQEQEDVKELFDMKGQLDNDVQTASADLEVLLRNTKDLNDNISDKSGETYDSENGTIASKHKAIRRFLLSTLQNENQENRPIIKENEVLRNKANNLRIKVRSKFLSSEGVSDDEINDLLREYEDLLDQHAEIFKQLDQEANDSVEDFNKHGDLWKKLFTEGMDLEKRCDDIDYVLEGLSDKESQLRRLKAALEKIYADYLSKFRYVTEQQKGIIDELRTDIRSLETEIANLRRQIDQGSSELSVESQAYARGRNTKNDAALENIMGNFVGVHQQRRRVQDDGENIYDEWVKNNKEFIDGGYAEYGVGRRDRGTIIRIQELIDQIFQSNEDIEHLLADLQRIQREKGINDHRNTL